MHKTPHTSCFRCIVPAIVLVFVSFLLLEAITRVFFAVRGRDPGMLLFSRRRATAAELGRAEPGRTPDRARPEDGGVKRAKRRIRGGLRLPPGTCRFQAADGSVHDVPINAGGFRGRDFDDVGVAARVVVTLGGSSTFCAECPVGTAWPERLEAIYNERNGSGHLAVVNRAMLGMSTRQVAELFEGDIRQRDVDLVLVCTAFNAMDPPVVVDLQPDRAAVVTRLLWGRSLLYTTLHTQWLARRQRHAGCDTRRHYREELQRMVRAAADASIPLAFVLQPMLDPGRKAIDADVAHIPLAQARRQLNMLKAVYPYHARYLEAMSQVGQASGTPVLDPRPAVLSGPDAADNFVLSLHLTPRGADRMARALAPEVERLLRGM